MNTSMPIPEVEELVGAYALDALDPDERALVDEHLAVCPRCRAELAGHLEVVAMLAEGAPAPEGLWTRISDELEGTPPQMRLRVAEISSARTRRLPRPAMFAAVAAAAAVIVLLAGVVVRQEGRIDELAGEGDLARAAGLAMADPASSRTVLSPPEGGDGPTATVVVAADGTGFLMTPDLPELPPENTYQLWGIVGEEVISLGVLGRRPAVSVFEVDEQVPVAGFAVTVEPAGGVVSSQNPPTLVGTAS